MTGLHAVPLWAALLQLALPPYNALYFGKQVNIYIYIYFFKWLIEEATPT